MPAKRTRRRPTYSRARRVSRKASYSRRRPAPKRTYARTFRAKTSIPRGMTGVESVLAAPHSLYAKSDKNYTDTRGLQRSRIANIRRVSIAARKAREPYRDLYRRPNIIQPKVDNWTWLTDPDLHYRMNRTKYDKFFKGGLGLAAKGLGYLIGGSPGGKVARGLSDALFDVATDFDLRKPFDSSKLVNTALKTGKSIIVPPIKSAIKKEILSAKYIPGLDPVEWKPDYLSFSDRYGYRAGRFPAFADESAFDYRENPNEYLKQYDSFFQSPQRENLADLLPRDPDSPILLKKRSRLTDMLLPDLNYGKAKTSWTPRKTWRDYIFRPNAPKTRATSQLENMLRTQSIDQLEEAGIITYPDGSRTWSEKEYKDPYFVDIHEEFSL